MKHHRLSAPKSALVALALLAASAAQSATVHGMRDYFESLAGNYSAQVASNTWTFHDSSHLGAYLSSGASSYVGPVSPQQIGMLVNAGTLSCTPGFCGGASLATTSATFDGVFVHSGSPTATVAVFHADAAVQLDQIRLLSEMVQNGHNGDGMSVQVRAIVAGIAQDIGSFDMTYALSVNTAIETIYTPGLSLSAGDRVEVRYGMRNSYLYDHGNVDLWITTSPSGPGGSGGGNVPEPTSLALVGVGLLAALRSRRPARA